MITLGSWDLFQIFLKLFRLHFVYCDALEHVVVMVPLLRIVDMRHKQNASGAKSATLCPAGDAVPFAREKSVAVLEFKGFVLLKSGTLQFSSFVRLVTCTKTITPIDTRKTPVFMGAR